MSRGCFNVFLIIALFFGTAAIRYQENELESELESAEMQERQVQSHNIADSTEVAGARATGKDASGCCLCSTRARVQQRDDSSGNSHEEKAQVNYLFSDEEVKRNGNLLIDSSTNELRKGKSVFCLARGEFKFHDAEQKKWFGKTKCSDTCPDGYDNVIASWKQRGGKTKKVMGPCPEGEGISAKEFYAQANAQYWLNEYDEKILENTERGLQTINLGESRWSVGLAFKTFPVSPDSTSFRVVAGISNFFECNPNMLRPNEAACGGQYVRCLERCLVNKDYKIPACSASQ